MATPRTLRPYQTDAIALVRNSLTSGHIAPMLALPTGSGKTVIAANIVAGLVERHKRVCFCVSRLSLVDQTFERFVENGLEPTQMGVIQGNHAWRRPHAPVQIAMVQTLARREYPDVDAVIIDEAHELHSAHKAWMAESQAYRASNPGKLPKPFFIGLSATPWAKGLGRHFDDLLAPVRLADLIEAGSLSKFRVFAPSHPDLSGIKTVAGDYHEGQLGERMSNAVLVANIVETWLAKGEDRTTLVFAVNRAHARALADQFEAAGVTTAYVDCDTPKDEREEIGRRFAAGDVRVVVNIGTLTTGVDWDVRCIVLARPTKSEMLFVQMIGRGLRTAPGKAECLILDHSDTHLRLGFVTQIEHTELDDGSKGAGGKASEKSEPLPWECTECHAVVPPGIRECCECGFVRRRQQGVEYADGDLAELSSDGTRGKAVSIADQIRAQGKAAVYAQLLWYAEERNRAIGWAGHAYKELFGVWPQGLSKRFAVEPAPLMRSWLRSRDIRFAKSMSARVNAAGVTHA